MQKKELIELAKKIKPLVRLNDLEDITMSHPSSGGKLCFIEPTEIASKSYTWDAQSIRHLEIANPEASKLCEIETQHSGCSFLFKPSIKEVLEQIPSGLLKHCTAFELHSPDLQPNSCGINSAKVILYSFKLPKTIAEQHVICDGETYIPSNETEQSIKSRQATKITTLHKQPNLKTLNNSNTNEPNK